MRILQINNFHFPHGGADRYFLDISNLLSSEGHHVGTFSTDNPNNTQKDLLVVKTLNGVDTNKIKDFSNIANYLYSNEAKREMIEAIKSFKPDIAHLHIYYGQLTASILGPLRKAGIPIIQTLHEYKLVCPTHGLYSQGNYCDACQGKNYWHAILKKCNRGSLSRSTLSMAESYLSEYLGSKKNVDHYIAVSDFQKQQLVRLGINEEKLSVLHHFADTSYNPPKELGEYFLYVGRIVEDKGIKILLEAYARLKKGRPPLKVVGDDSNISSFKNYCQKLGIADDVSWTGFKNGDELDKLYHRSLVIINPSLLNETFGLTCLEA